VFGCSFDRVGAEHPLCLIMRYSIGTNFRHTGDGIEADARSARWFIVVLSKPGAR
jgi:hypothetical protein